MRYGAHFMFHVGHVMKYPFGLIDGIETPLEPRVVSGNACRAGVFIALKRLNAAECEHKAACGGDKIRAHTSRPAHFPRRDQFAGCNHFDALAQAVLGEDIDHERQALVQGQADAVDQAHGGCAGAAVAAIHSYKVGRVFSSTRGDFAAQIVQPIAIAEHRRRWCIAVAPGRRRGLDVSDWDGKIWGTQK